jgi:pSer/pThr/pTyr-binding forkhead associated (FHA) protein
MMAKLLVVSGPNRGATYFLDDGEVTLGRSPECQVVLASTQVSKRHCALVIQRQKAELRDLGSSNGTFVNGVLTKKRLLKNRDKISVGPFVLEVILPEAKATATASDAFADSGLDSGSGVVPPVSIDPGLMKLEEEPKGLVAKYKKKFDDVFLPVLFDFYQKTEYSNLLAMMFGVFVLINLGFTVYPTLQSSREEVVRQAEHQAMYIADQLSKLNRQAILEEREGALITEFATSETHVREAVIANLEGRIMAPGDRLNESYNNPQFLRYRDSLKRSQNLWGKTRKVRLADKEEIVAFAPVMVMSKTKGIPIPGAIATVIYSTEAIALDSGTVGTVYLEALFWSGLLGIIFLYLVYAVTHRPMEKLTDDMDLVLKGERDSVEKTYKNEVIDRLIDTINSALSRLPKSGQGEQANVAANDGERMIIDNLMRSIEFLATQASHPMLILDTEYRIKMNNVPFEELTGIRGGQGEVIDTVSRDESLPALMKEMMGNAIAAGHEGIRENYDFNSGSYQILATAIVGMPNQAECFLFLFEKQGE